MLAAHVARRMTGRKFILMARHGYHGSYDDLEVGLAGQEGERTMLADFGDATPSRRCSPSAARKSRRCSSNRCSGSAGVVIPPAGFPGASAGGDAAGRDAARDR